MLEFATVPAGRSLTESVGEFFAELALLVRCGERPLLTAGRLDVLRPRQVGRGHEVLVEKRREPVVTASPP